VQQHLSDLPNFESRTVKRRLAGALAEDAAHVEIDVLGEPVGKQNQYNAAFGGLTCFEFHPDDRLTVTLRAVSQALHDLEERQLLFFTGYARPAGAILADQHARTEQGDAAMLGNLEWTKELGLQIRAALEAGEPERFGRMMREHWGRKRARSSSMSDPDIDRWYERASEENSSAREPAAF
jgi:D-glycero-alpha-D-manno-heptose-7-phosphate kinase